MRNDGWIWVYLHLNFLLWFMDSLIEFVVYVYEHLLTTRYPPCIKLPLGVKLMSAVLIAVILCWERGGIQT